MDSEKLKDWLIDIIDRWTLIEEHEKFTTENARLREALMDVRCTIPKEYGDGKECEICKYLIEIAREALKPKTVDKEKSPPSRERRSRKMKVKRIGWAIRNGTITIPSTTRCTRSEAIDDYFFRDRSWSPSERKAWWRKIKWLTCIPVYEECQTK